VKTPVRKQPAWPLERELKTAEFHVGHLVRGDHFVPGKIVVWCWVAVDHRRQEDLRAIRRSHLFINPANALAEEGDRVVDVNGRARQGTAVELYDPFNWVEF
jgi:hypothetical protein